MHVADATLTPDATRPVRFPPWVRRAGFSIVVVAALVTAAIASRWPPFPSTRYGWIGEPFVWVYVGTLWARRPEGLARARAARSPR